MRAFSTLIVVTLAWLAAVPVAMGHGIPIELIQTGGKLHTDAQVYTSTLNLVAGTVLTTQLPGFDVTSPGVGIPNGTAIGVNFMDRLWYWDGTNLATPTSDFIFENDLGALFTIDATSGFQSGPNLGTYNGSGGWPAHGFYSLEPISSPVGAYGLVMQAKGGAYQPSDPFLVVFNHGLSAGAFQQGVDAITNEVFAVPEPSSVAMLGFGMAGVGVVVTRRRHKQRLASLCAA